MKVLGIVCSPRVEGNTAILVREALDAAQDGGAEVELLSMAGLNIAPCDGCRSCRDGVECQIKDDMEPIYQKMKEADGIIVGTPVYFWSVSAQAKILIDRTLALYYPRALANKAGAAIAVAGRSGTAMAIVAIQNAFLSHKMLWAGSLDGYGSDPGAIRNDARAMTDVRGLGERVIETIQRAKALAG